MSIQSAMQAGVAGLDAQSTKFATISDNISNSQTDGYKRSVADFASQVVDAGSHTTYTAGGVSTNIVREIERAGTVKGTTSATDLAINGAGFFLVKAGLPANQANESPLLTRVGASALDKDGFLRLHSGYYLQGVPLGIDGKPTSSVVQSVKLNQSPSTPTTSTSVNFRTNLPASLGAASTAGTPLETSMSYVDELGTNRSLSFSWTPAAGGVANDWGLSITDDTGATVHTDTISFNKLTGAGGAAGYPATGEVLNFTMPVAGKSTPLSVKLDLTQFDYDYNPSFSTDGIPVSDFAGVEVGADGSVYSVYKNGSRTPQFQLAMGDVTNPAGLTPVASNAYATTIDSGDLITRTAGQGTVGTIQSYSVEGSNVDIAEELTDMITTQRVYSANASIITTSDQMLDEAVHLKR